MDQRRRPPAHREPDLTPVRDFAAPRSWPLTAEGAWGLALSAALLAIGLAKNINLITLFACLLLALLIANVLSCRRQLRGLKATRWIDEPVFAQASTRITVEVRHEGKRKRAGITALDHGARHEARWYLPEIRGGEIVTLTKEITLRRRGRYLWAPLYLLSTFPAGLARRVRAAAAARELIVLPALGQLHRGRLRRLLSEASPTLGQARTFPRRHPTAQAEFHGLRSFRSGDSPRWIHWRTSARRGELMVREFEDTPTDNLIVVVDATIAASAAVAGIQALEADLDNPARQQLETAIRLAATVCWEWCRKKGDRLALAVAGAAPTVTVGVTGQAFAIALLERLALETGATRPDLEALSRHLTAADLPPGPVLLISAQVSDLPAMLERQLQRRVACVSVADGSYSEFFSPTPASL